MCKDAPLNSTGIWKQLSVDGKYALQFALDTTSINIFYTRRQESLHFLFVLMIFSLNAFSEAAATLCEPHDARLMPSQFLWFKMLTHEVTEYWWSVDAANCTTDIVQAWQAIFFTRLRII